MIPLNGIRTRNCMGIEPATIQMSDATVKNINPNKYSPV